MSAMSTLKHNPFLKNETEREAFFARHAGITHRGMASWAGTGPVGKTCGDCAHYYGGCAMFRKLVNPKRTPSVPSDARACKYFEQKLQRASNNRGPCREGSAE
jgi:hypothetical protein